MRFGLAILQAPALLRQHELMAVASCCSFASPGMLPCRQGNMTSCGEPHVLLAERHSNAALLQAMLCA